MQPVRYSGKNVAGNRRRSPEMFLVSVLGKKLEEAVLSRGNKRIQGSKQDDSEGSEESKEGPDRYVVLGDLNFPEQN